MDPEDYRIASCASLVPAEELVPYLQRELTIYPRDSRGHTITTRILRRAVRR